VLASISAAWVFPLSVGFVLGAFATCCLAVAFSTKRRERAAPPAWLQAAARRRVDSCRTCRCVGRPACRCGCHEDESYLPDPELGLPPPPEPLF